MKHYLFPKHSMIVKSVDYVDKLKQIEALQRENEQLQARNGVYRDALERIDQAGNEWEAGVDCEALMPDTGKDYHNPADVEALKQAREILQDMVDVANTCDSAYLYKKDTGKVIGLLAAIDKAVGE
jgi:hypothetical protein